MERKLAAILATDVVGFSGLIARDEAGTLARLERVRRDIIDMQVGARRGRVFKALGDGFLAEFSSTVEAVNCAIGIQRACAQEARRDEDCEALQLRVGVSLGDVVVDGDDLLGDGVNIAARLEAMAEPGGIAVSAEVMAQIRGKIDLPLEDCGFQRLKTSDQPVHVYMTRDRKAAGGLFDFDENALDDRQIEGGCLCGAVRYAVSAPPIATGYCHCRICQQFTGSAMSTWTAFPASAVRFTGAEPKRFRSTPIAERGFCGECGASLTYRLIRPRPAPYLVMFTSSLDRPQDFAPAIHSGLESKLPWLEIVDDLPRTNCAESRVLQEAWASVGLPNPGAWGPGAKPLEPF